jgi:uncharacterized membrane protein
MSESQDKRAVYMGTFEAYKKTTAKHMVELVDTTKDIWEFTHKNVGLLYTISIAALVLSIIGLVI